MKSKKIYLIVIIIATILPIKCFSYDYLYSDINSELISTLSTLNELPKVNARNCIVLDRSSKTVLYGKAENEKCKMASTTNIVTT